jgi:hypothetical protein
MRSVFADTTVDVLPIEANIDAMPATKINPIAILIIISIKVKPPSSSLSSADVCYLIMAWPNPLT